MARQQTLATLRSMLKAETGQSLSVGTQKDTIFNNLLANTQTWLASEYDFPFMFDRWDVAVGAGSRYFAAPTTAVLAGANHAINFERPVNAYVKWNDTWQNLEYGIGQDEFNASDADQNEHMDPVQRWTMSGNSNIEIWPIPAGNQTIRFVGQRALTTFAVDADLADLDGLLIVLFAAAKIAAANKQADAPVLLQAAQLRLARLRGAYSAKTQAYIVGGAPGETVRTIPMKIIAVSG